MRRPKNRGRTAPAARSFSWSKDDIQPLAMAKAEQPVALVEGAEFEPVAIPEIEETEPAMAEDTTTPVEPLPPVMPAPGKMVKVRIERDYWPRAEFRRVGDPLVPGGDQRRCRETEEIMLPIEEALQILNKGIAIRADPLTAQDVT